MLVAENRIHSSRRRQRWEEWELQVLKHAPRTDEEKASFMGRTVHAVQCKRHELNTDRKPVTLEQMRKQLNYPGRCRSCARRYTEDCLRPRKAKSDMGECVGWKSL